jgi:hypothetical protein
MDTQTAPALSNGPTGRRSAGLSGLTLAPLLTGVETGSSRGHQGFVRQPRLKAEAVFQHFCRVLGGAVRRLALALFVRRDSGGRD